MRSEFDFIKRVRDKSQKQSAISNQQSALSFGIGDDAAIIRKDSKHDFVITADLLVEDIDFRLEWTRPHFLGHKALAVSLSDVAAMGAKPVFALLSIGVPKKIWRTKFVDEFYNGWLALAEKYNVQLIGGDVSKTGDKVVIDSIVIGETQRGRAILRSGAKTGDLIFVTGNLGGAAAGLKLLENLEGNGLTPLLRSTRNLKRHDKSHSDFLLLKQLRPSAQVEIGEIIGKENLATAMIDISDGLSSDLAHLCKESNVGATIEGDTIPIEPAIASHFSVNKEQLNFALNGGEDFELLFTVNPRKEKKLRRILKNHEITQIGSIAEKTNHISIILKGKKRPLKPAGFVHF